MISYVVRKSLRAKNVRITIKADASVIVTMPYRMDERKALKLIEEKEMWILRSIEKIKKRYEENNGEERMSPKGTKKEFEEYKDQALVFVSARLEYFNKEYGYT